MAQTEIEIRNRRGRAELIAALGDARDGIRRDATELGDLVNVPKRIRTSLADAPLRRAATAVAAGLISSKLFSRKKRSRSGDEKPRWLHRLFPEFDLKKIIRLLLKSYLEPEEIDLRALIRERLRDYLK